MVEFDGGVIHICCSSHGCVEYLPRRTEAKAEQLVRQIVYCFVAPARRSPCSPPDELLNDRGSYRRRSHSQALVSKLLVLGSSRAIFVRPRRLTSKLWRNSRESTFVGECVTPRRSAGGQPLAKTVIPSRLTVALAVQPWQLQPQTPRSRKTPRLSGGNPVL